MRARAGLALGAMALIVVALAALTRVGETEVREEVFADVGPLAEGASYLAFARDFEGYRSWERHWVEGAMIPTGATPGPTYIYLNHRPPAGTRSWPVGTILVKEIQSGDPEDWVVHAMVKRGVPYNAHGAAGWEFFELDVAPDGVTDVVWRGQSPPSGHGYGAVGRDAGIDASTLTCNDCHAANWQNDSVLTPALSLLPLPAR